MAKVKYFNLLNEDTDLGSIFVFDDMELQDGATARKAIYISSETGDKLVLSGKSLSYEGDAIIAGTITNVTFADDGGRPYLKIQGAKAHADQAWADYDQSGVYNFFPEFFKGKDRIVGSNQADDINGYGGKDVIIAGRGDDGIFAHSGNDRVDGGKGNDTIFGSTGNDILKGGKGSDDFRFYGLDNKDVIIDFDAVGGGSKQDYITMADDQVFTIKKMGKDLLLTFEDDGDTIRLLDVSKADFKIADDVHYFDVN